MNKTIIISDMHLDSTEDPHPSYGLAKLFIKQQKPNILVILGDAFDFSYISSFDAEKNLLKENKRIQHDYDLFNKDLDFFQKYAEKIYFFEGNHERRIQTTVEKNPHLENVIEVPIRLHLKSRKIKWIPEIDQPIKIGNLYFLHGQYYNIFYTKKTLEEYGVSIVMAHTHRIQQYTKSFSATGVEISAYGIGCLTDKNPSFLHGRSTNHMNGIGVCFQEGKTFSFHNIHINNNKFIWNGKVIA